MDNVTRLAPAMLPAPQREWRWRTQDGTMLRPSVMVTRHLHHTLVMIWHHTMPEAARVRQYYVAYSFSAFYTKEYMLQAVRVMMAELVSRDDMRPEWLAELRKMDEYLNPRAGRVTAVRKIQGE